MEGFQKPEKSLEEQARLMDEQQKTQEEMAKGGAPYSVREYKDGRKGVMFDPTQRQIEEARKEMINDQKGTGGIQTSFLRRKKSREGVLSPEEQAMLDSWEEFGGMQQHYERKLFIKEKLGTIMENERKVLEIFRKANSEKRNTTLEEDKQIKSLKL
jgi:hypothetical protein